MNRSTYRRIHNKSTVILSHAKRALNNLNMQLVPTLTNEHLVARVSCTVPCVSCAGQEQEQAVQGAAGAQEEADEVTVKLAWGKLWTCSALDSPGGTTAYSSYKPVAPNDPDAEPQAHCLPSLRTQEALDDAIQYAVELKHIQATCLNGRIPVAVGVDVDGPHMQVRAVQTCRVTRMNSLGYWM
jgi:hypothetical protein